MYVYVLAFEICFRINVLIIIWSRANGDRACMEFSAD
jgi:hypothetical protein